MAEAGQKTAIVTGASKGMGLKIASTLIAEGYLVAACSRTVSRSLDALIKAHPETRHFPFDLEEAQSVKDCASDILKAYERIDILVNCAGMAAGGLFGMTRIEDLKRVFEVNYFNQILFSQYIVKKMTRAKAGSIINIASTAGLRADPGTLSYGGSKAALIHATRVMAAELGPMGIRVNAIAPAVVDTDMAALMDEKARTQLDERSALKGAVEPNDVADLVAFLASDKSRKITGQVLRVDRGLR